MLVKEELCCVVGPLGRGPDNLVLGFDLDLAKVRVVDPKVSPFEAANAREQRWA